MQGDSIFPLFADVPDGGHCRTGSGALVSNPTSVAFSNRGFYARVLGGKAGVSSLDIHVGVQSGNVSVAVYRNNGLLGTAARPTGSPVATSGSVACPATGRQTISLGSTVDINAGDWLFLSADNSTATFGRFPSAGVMATLPGVAYYQASAHPAPTVGSLADIDRVFYIEAP